MNTICVPIVSGREAQSKRNFKWCELAVRLLYTMKQVFTGFVKRICDQIEEAHEMEKRLRDAKLRNEMSNPFYYIR